MPVGELKKNKKQRAPKQPTGRKFIAQWQLSTIPSKHAAARTSENDAVKAQLQAFDDQEFRCRSFLPLLCVSPLERSLLTMAHGHYIVTNATHAFFFPPRFKTPSTSGYHYSTLFRVCAVAAMLACAPCFCKAVLRWTR